MSETKVYKERERRRAAKELEQKAVAEHKRGKHDGKVEDCMEWGCRALLSRATHVREGVVPL